MGQSYFCDYGVASARSLHSDDEAAAECLYPEVPTVILIDETGSMAMGDRIGDDQDAAHAFIDELAGLLDAARDSDAAQQDGG